MRSRDDFGITHRRLEPLAERIAKHRLAVLRQSVGRWSRRCSALRFLESVLTRFPHRWFGLSIVLLVWGGNPFRAQANPDTSTATVPQGVAFSTSGSQLTINQNIPYAYINWQKFNIAAGETTTFNQPSATSVTWNYINDPNAPSKSTIEGTLDANGYVILQNPSGFYVGGQASINTHGLIMTTASTPALNLSSGGPWFFNTPPPNANIINYGKIKITGGGSAYLIASDIKNGNDPNIGTGTISAPEGKIGLYSGQKVLVSMAPDGRGLSAQLTLPEGSVDNEGNLIADGGSIVAQAQIVNQNGLVQANSAQDVNGTIELVASGSQSSLNLDANSVISADGDAAASSASPGGFVVLKSDHPFADAPTSKISVSGHSGGQDGIIEIFDPGANANSIQSSIGSFFAYLLNPDNITLSSSGTDTSSSNPNFNLNDLSVYSQIDLAALNNIELSSLWNLSPHNDIPYLVSLLAGNAITVDSGSGIQADAGKIALNATTVNQNGILQANSIQNHSGAIEINASSAANLGANSVTSANGDAANNRPGGSVTVQSDAITLDNNAAIQADAGKIALNASTVNQNGILQANAIQNNSGTIEINASSAANLGANSVTSANGDAANDGPGGSVTVQSDTITLDNNAAIEADAGKIALNATTVNQNGLLQANSIQNHSGSIDINASGVANLNANSLITANGDAVSASPGGSVTVQSDTLTLDQDAGIHADAGKIALNAATVNQDGTLQANSIQNTVGSIDIHGNDSVNLGANSVISASGDATAVSDGGVITVKSDKSFSDQNGSAFNVAGGAQGGNGGQVAISAPQMSAFQSSVNGGAIAGYTGGRLSIDTTKIALNADGSAVAGALALAVNSSSWFDGLSQINLQASGDIDLIQGSQWTLGNFTAASLLAGGTITVGTGARIESDAGEISLSAPTVNQYGTLQANSVGSANGVIDIHASGANGQLSLGNQSVISAKGDASSTSPGGFVILKSDNLFSDIPGSTISVLGNMGGQNGVVEIFGKNVVDATSILSTIAGGSSGYYAYLINPGDIYFSSSATTTTTQPANTSQSLPNPYAIFNVTSGLSAFSKIDLQALDNMDLQALDIYNTPWKLAESTDPAATLSLTAGNNINFQLGTIGNFSGIKAGKNWNVNLTAGAGSSSGGINLAGNSYVEAQNGDLNLWALDDVIVNNGAIRTVGGGNIDVTAQNGNVNSGTSVNGFTYLASAPYYTPSSALGGISTAAGGNVTINAGGDVISFSTTKVATGDPGTGAFGSEPGNLTIKAGGSVYGHYVVMNGVGTITAGQDIGTLPGATASNPNADSVALSLAKGSWNLDAQNDIYLQEVRNPNGVFNNTTTGFSVKKPSAGNHLFDYDPYASVTLTAGNGIHLTGYDLPRPNGTVPLLMPPTLIINAGSGGVVLNTPNAIDANGKDITSDMSTVADLEFILFPSPYGNLEITTTSGGGLSSGNWMTSTDPNHNTPDTSTTATLLMSDSGRTQWFDQYAFQSIPYEGPVQFGATDHASSPAELNNPDPVVLNISGDMKKVVLQVSKFANLTVDGDMIGSSFFGENLQPGQATTLNVLGQIYNAGSFNFVTLDEAFPTLPVSDLPPGDLNTLFQILQLAVNQDAVFNLDPTSTSAGQIYANASEFPSLNTANLFYDPTTQKLTTVGPLSDDLTSLLTALESPYLYFVVYGPNGLPVISDGHFVTDKISWASAANIAAIQTLAGESKGASLLQSSGGCVVGGMGDFDINAGSISLGNSAGILSVGNGRILGRDYSFLTPYLTASGISGANINVTADTLEMPSSTIAALGGGDVKVTCTSEIVNSPKNSHGIGVSMDLGSQDLVQFEGAIMKASKIGLGIYTSGGGDVTVTAPGTINIDSSRIGSFNGGDVFVESDYGDMNAGSGGSIAVPIQVFSPYANSDVVGVFESVYANGIVAETLYNPSLIPGSATIPGDIEVLTPQGDINANLGGIKQETLNGTAPSGPTITLEAGTPAHGDWSSSDTPLFIGNIDLGTVGAIGENVIARATGEIKGLVISRHNTSLTSQTVAGLTVLAGGTANVTAQSSGSGQAITIIGGAGVSASGVGVGAKLLGQNVSVNGGAATSTLGTSANATAASQSAAGQASSESQQQIASNDNGNDDKKKKKKKQGLVRSVGRVTVILPHAS